MRRQLICALPLLPCVDRRLAPASPSQPSPRSRAKRHAHDRRRRGVMPDYEGSDDYRIIPAGRSAARSAASHSRPGHLSLRRRHPGGDKVEFDVGPIVGVGSTAPAHQGRRRRRCCRDRKTAIEVGGFAGVSFHGLTNPYDTLALQRRRASTTSPTRTSRRSSRPNVDILDAAVAHDLRQRCRSARSSSATNMPIIISASRPRIRSRPAAYCRRSMPTAG